MSSCNLMQLIVYLSSNYLLQRKPQFQDFLETPSRRSCFTGLLRQPMIKRNLIVLLRYVLSAFAFVGVTAALSTVVVAEPLAAARQVALGQFKVITLRDAEFVFTE